MKKIDDFTNLYNISKTLKFRLIPMWETDKNFSDSGIFEEDESRDKDYQDIKGYIINYHKQFIESVLSKIQEFDVREYSKLYYLKNKSDDDQQEIYKIEKNMRDNIVKFFKEEENYKNKKNMFSDELIKKFLPRFYDNDADALKKIDRIKTFTTYFTRFNDNMKNIYTEECKKCGIANRCITDNLPKFLDNSSVVEKNLEAITAMFENVAKDFDCSIDYLKTFFTADNFKKVLAQSGIDKYNNFIGGFTNKNDEKKKGLNEYISEYNAQNKDKKPIPKMIRLYKQILSDRKSNSFLLYKFQNDKELLDAVDEQTKLLLEGIKAINNWLLNFNDYEWGKIYLCGGTNVNWLSNAIKKDWRFIQTRWEEETLESKGKKRNIEKLKEDLCKQWKNILLPIDYINRYLQQDEQSQDEKFTDWYKRYVNDNIKKFEQSYKNYKNTTIKIEKLVSDDERIKILKELLDSMKAVEKAIYIFNCNRSIEEKDIKFYDDFDYILEYFLELDRLYDQVRNYVTRKPFSQEKIKINFGHYQLLKGWSRSKEKDYRGALFINGNNYYLGIMDKKHTNVLEKYEQNESNGWKKVNYYFLAGAAKTFPRVVFPKNGENECTLSAEIEKIKNEKSFKQDSKNYSIDDCRKWIDYHKQFIENRKEWEVFNFDFKKTEEYESFNEFCNDVDRQGYKIIFENISENYVIIKKHLKYRCFLLLN